MTMRDLEIPWEAIGDDNTINGVKFEINPDMVILQLKARLSEARRYKKSGQVMSLSMLKSWGII